MTNVERFRSLARSTVGSEGFEKFSRKPIGIVTAILLLGLGLGSVEGVIDSIDREMVKQAILYGIQASVELGASGSIVIANFRSRMKSRS